MKKNFCFVLITVLLLWVSGCSDNSTIEEINPLLDNIYVHNSPSEKTFDFEYMKFYSDNTFQGLHVSLYKDIITDKIKHENTNYYGTYEINKNALTMNISNDTFSGAITDNGDSISFGNDKYVKWTIPIDSDDPILYEFK